MNVGDEVYWTDDNGIRRICEISDININQNSDIKYYTILLPERNVMLENISGDGYKKGDTVIYSKRNKDYIAHITKINHSSDSAQIRIVIDNLILAY